MRYKLYSPDGLEIGYITDKPEFRWEIQQDFPFRSSVEDVLKKSEDYEMVVTGGEIEEDDVTPPEEDVPTTDRGRLIRVASELPRRAPVQVSEVEDVDKENIAEELTNLVKERIYVDSPEEVPEGAEPQEGQQGGIYYETDDIHGTGEEGEDAGAPWEHATFEEMGDVLVDVVGEDEVELLADVLPESAGTGDAVALMEDRMRDTNMYDSDDLHELYMSLGEAFGSPLSPSEEEDGEEQEGGEETDDSQDGDGGEEGGINIPERLSGNLSLNDAAELVAGVAGEKASYALLGDMRASDQGEQPNPERYVTQAAQSLPREGRSQLQDLLDQEAEDREEQEQQEEEYSSEVPNEPEEAVDRIVQNVSDEADASEEQIRENWSEIINGEVNALEGPEDERHEAVEQGLEQLEENEDFQELLEEHDISPSVVVADPEKLNENAGYQMFSPHAEAERKAGVSWLHSHPLNTTQTEPEKPEPGQSVSSSDIGSVLRHEMTHDLWDEAGKDFRQWFRFEGLPNDNEKVEEGLTAYANDRPEEAFTELVTVTTNPKYDPQDYPEWVRNLSEDVKARLRGEKETEFDIDDIKEDEESGDKSKSCSLRRNTPIEKVAQEALKQKIDQMRNERRESYVEVGELQTPEIDFEENKTFRKAGENFELVDDLLMEAFEKQIWEEDMQKAPNMWRRDDEVPQFVRSHVKDAIDKTDALHGDFADIPHTAALKIHEIIKDQLTDPQGWSIETVTKELSDEFQQLALEEAETIARTEISAVLNKAREIAYDAAKAATAANRARNITGLPGTEHPGGEEGEDEILYYWAGPEDSRTTTICSNTKDRIEDEGGYVTKDRLKEILREEAKEHKEEDGGLPERVVSFIPHYQCRHTFIRSDYQRVT